MILKCLVLPHDIMKWLMRKESSILRASELYRDDDQSHEDTVIEFIDPARSPVTKALAHGSLFLKPQAEDNFWLPFFAYCPLSHASAIKDIWLSFLPVLARIFRKARMWIASWPLPLVNLLGRLSDGEKAEVRSRFCNSKRCCIPLGVQPLGVCALVRETGDECRSVL